MKPGRVQTKCVSVYFDPGYVEDTLDPACKQARLRRNDYIKRAIEEKLIRDNRNNPDSPYYLKRMPSH